MLTPDGPELAAQPAMPINPDNLLIQGIHLSFLSTFISDCGGRDALLNLTTEQVCQRFIIPKSVASESFCNQLALHISHVTAPARWFISHTWQYLFLDTVDALFLFFEKRTPSEPDPVIWIDIFSLPQVGREKMEVEWLRTVFCNSIATMGNLISVLSPWDKPIALTRTWCLYEVFTGGTVNANVHFAMPPHDMRTFQSELLKHPDRCRRTIFMLSGLRLMESNATKEDDRKAIEEVVDHYELDSIILDLYVKWTAQVLLSLISIAESSGDELDLARLLRNLGKLHLGGLIDYDQIDIDPAMEVDGVDVQMQELRLHFSPKGVRINREGATSPISRSLEIRERVLGPHHPETLAAVELLADVERGRGNKSGERALYSRLLEGKRQELGTDDPALLEYIEKLGGAEAVELAKRTLGDDDPETHKFMSRLGDIYASQGSLDHAVEWYRNSIYAPRRASSEETLIVMDGVRSLARIYLHKGDYELAAQVLREGASRAERAWGKGDVMVKNFEELLKEVEV
ncbi:Kinesin light chain 3 [Rhizophlyctis rosea]|nr:Kinesin light chain 3 [Rhizophlyctis rosea]